MARTKADKAMGPEGFPAYIRALLALRNVSQGTIAERMDISRRYVNKVVAGHERLKRERFAELAEIVGADPDELMFRAGYLPDDLEATLYTVDLAKLRTFVRKHAHSAKVPT